MADLYVCIHGHFYQPPRENPWLEDVELQDSAYPYHDWNAKITQECYRQNAASRILGPDKKIIDIINNYSKISFNFGPTLLSWLEKHAPDVYESIFEADKISREIFSGHGAAIACAYNHIIMPLASTRDKRTEVIWAISDFQHRFARKPEGMWLPETAVDLETLEILAEQDIKFSILAPHQAKRVRKIGSKQWKEIEQGKIDTTKPYLCRLASGRAINLFFYHGPTALDVVDGRILQNGENFARKLAGIFQENYGQPQLAHIATDGETYGHHHRHTDMALAYCLHYIESNGLAKITVYGEYLEKFPPDYEVEILENTSWSCSHGIERWRSNCGCFYGRYPSGAQQWRGPLREAMDWLRDQLAKVFEDKMSKYTSDVWELRDRYISVINDRSAENVEKFLATGIGREVSYGEKVIILKLLEMQRHALLMYTSCGWFFDDICGLEAVQIMQYASRAIQLVKETDGRDFEPQYMAILEKAPTNVPKFANGKEAYKDLIKPTSIDLNRVGAHLAISSVFDEYTQQKDIYCYCGRVEAYDRSVAGVQILATGRATIKSNIVYEKHPVDFAVLHFGEQNLIAAVNARMSDDAFGSMQQNLKNAFAKGDTTEIMRVMNTSFSANTYSLWHLFKDQQQRILYELLETTWKEIEASFRQIYEHNYALMQIMRGMNMPLPKALSTPAEFILNQDLCAAIRQEEINLNRLQRLAEEADKFALALDKATLRFEASRKINSLMNRLQETPADMALLIRIQAIVKTLFTIVPQLDLETAQNIFFAMSKKTFPARSRDANSGDATAKEWIEHFRNLGQHLGISS